MDNSSTWEGNSSLVGSRELLKDSLDQHSFHIEDIMDSLECTDLQQQLGATERRGVSQLKKPHQGPHQPAAQSGGSALASSQSTESASRARTASALLSLLLEDGCLSGCAAEFLSLLSQVARGSVRPSLLLVPLEPRLLRAALQHPEDSVRAAACSLLGNLDPLVASATGTEKTTPKGDGNGHCGPSWRVPPALLQDLIGCLRDPSPSVRKRACRAVGTWLGLIALAAPGEGKTPGRSEEPKPPNRGNATAGHSAARGGKRRGSVGTGTGTCAGDPAAVPRADGGSEGWTEVALGAAVPLLALLRDPDALTRQHSCAALANAAGLRGGKAALLEADAQRLLQHTARTDSQHAVQRAAAGALCVFDQEDVQQQLQPQQQLQSQQQRKVEVKKVRGRGAQRVNT